MVRFAWPGWWLGLLVGIGTPAAAQVNDPVPKVELRENSPNPVTTTTTIPFEIHQEVCSTGRLPLVSLKIYNVLVQVVAVPVLSRDTTQPLDNVRLRCGEYRAFWDGKLLAGGTATAGVYYYQLTVDGERYTRKMIVQHRVTTSQR